VNFRENIQPETGTPAPNDSDKKDYISSKLYFWVLSVSKKVYDSAAIIRQLISSDFLEKSGQIGLAGLANH
jgi:hypothetical protein